MHRLLTESLYSALTEENLSLVEGRLEGRQNLLQYPFDLRIERHVMR